MAKVLNYGTLIGGSGYIERFDAVKVEDALIEAARDGKNIGLLKSFARGDCDGLTQDSYGSLMRQVLYVANLNNHDEVIKAMLGINPKSLDFYDTSLLGYDHIRNIYTELSGETGIDVADESST